LSISSTFYAHILRQYFGGKKFQTQHTAFLFMAPKFLAKKRARKTLMKLMAVWIRRHK